MTITLELPPEVETAVKTQALKDGLPLETYVTSLVKKAQLQRERIEVLAEKSFDEILEPFRRNVEESGMSDDDLDAIFSIARKAASRARKEGLNK